jgi:hypothetical protein
MTATGSGNTASWSGSHACNPVPVTNCTAVTITYSNATATLNGATLLVVATGTGSGCEAPAASPSPSSPRNGETLRPLVVPVEGWAVATVPALSFAAT